MTYTEFMLTKSQIEQHFDAIIAQKKIELSELDIRNRFLIYTGIILSCISNIPTSMSLVFAIAGIVGIVGGFYKGTGISSKEKSIADIEKKKTEFITKLLSVAYDKKITLEQFLASPDMQYFIPKKGEIFHTS